MNEHLYLKVHGFLALCFGAVFFYQGAINYFIHRQGLLDRRNTLYISLLCLFSGIYSLGSFYLLQDHPVYYNTHVFMSNWVCGSLIVTFYIKTLQTYFQMRSRLLDYLALPPILSASGAFLAETLYFVSDINLRLDPEAPYLEYKNIFMAFTGGYNPHLFVKSLVPLFLIPSVLAILIFLRHVIRTGQVFTLITIGLVLSLIGITIDGTMAVDDGRFRYMPPILFLSNFFEILRITYSNQINLGKKIFTLENSLIQSHKLAEAGDYFAKLSHEISNPLYAARSYFDLFVSKLDENSFSPKMRKYRTNIDNQFTHIQGLLSNVKDLTRPTQSQTFSTESLNSIISSSLEMTKMKAYHGGVSITHDDTEDHFISCFRDQMVQVVSNLIGNAIEAVEAENGWVKVTTKNSSAGTEIRVMDSGPGIPKEHQERIFEKRFSTKKELGNGLGLSICKSIVENHNGELYLNKNSPHTEFVVILPGAEA